MQYLENTDYMILSRGACDKIKELLTPKKANGKPRQEFRLKKKEKTFEIRDGVLIMSYISKNGKLKAISVSKDIYEFIIPKMEKATRKSGKIELTIDFPHDIGISHSKVNTTRQFLVYSGVVFGDRALRCCNEKKTFITDALDAWTKLSKL